ncbi:MAG: RNA ligase partner protein [Candidatus Bilamarchaeum sp.]|jgi:RNA ligase partner protein
MPEQMYVVDTSVFVNPQAREKFGKDPTLAVKGFIKFVKKNNLKVYMPPSIFAELRNFVKPQAIEELQIHIRIRSPSIYDIRLPAAVFYDFIEDVRDRINRGLRLSEEYAKDNTPNNDEKLRKLREKYREAMRTGILDSKEDLELVLIAKELDAVLVSSDEGVVKFARQLGCGIIPAEKFYQVLTNIKKSKGN